MQSEGVFLLMMDMMMMELHDQGWLFQLSNCVTICSRGFPNSIDILKGIIFKN